MILKLRKFRIGTRFLESFTDDNFRKQQIFNKKTCPSVHEIPKNSLFSVYLSMDVFGSMRDKNPTYGHPFQPYAGKGHQFQYALFH